MALPLWKPSCPSTTPAGGRSMISTTSRRRPHATRAAPTTTTFTSSNSGFCTRSPVASRSRNAPAAAQGLQPGRMVIEAVAAVTTTSDEVDDPFVFLDLTTTMRVNESLDVIVRPWARRLPGGDWDVLFYQAQIRYQPIDRLRIDAGILSSTLGMATLEMRQDLNPAVSIALLLLRPRAPVRSPGRSAAGALRRLSARRDRELLRQLVGRPRRGHRRHAGALPQGNREQQSDRPRRS